ncbi:MAG: response regulator [Hyphomicrobiaceae bacterium]
MADKLPPTILIAEDEPHIVESLTFLFEQKGYSVLTASDGADTLRVLRSRRPDLVILDVMMHHHTGFDVLRILRSEPAIAATKVLMLTAKGQNAERRLAQDLGADAFVAKPFSNRELVATAEALLQTKTRPATS